jgi:hypothetical protein
MDIQTSKIELVKLILNTNDQSLIEKVYNLFTASTSPGEEFTKAQIAEIELGIKQLESGRRIAFKDFLNKVS